MRNLSYRKGFFKISFIFREGKGRRKRGGEREGEKHQCVVASHAPHTGDLAHNPGMHPDWELNRWPFGLKPDTQSTEPHQQGWQYVFYQESRLLTFLAGNLRKKSVGGGFWVNQSATQGQISEHFKSLSTEVTYLKGLNKQKNSVQIWGM